SEATLIKEAARRVLAGESVRRIVLDWNARGVTPADDSLRCTKCGTRIAREHAMAPSLTDNQALTPSVRRRLRAAITHRQSCNGGTFVEPRWVVTSLRSMLAGARLAGLRVHEGEVVGEAAWPPILDRQTHEQLVAVLGDPRRGCKRGRPPLHLLAGMLRCA